MPRGDGTGPMGMGPMTGRAAGFCAGYGAPGYMHPMPGRSMGMGRGRGAWGGGRGWGRMAGGAFWGAGFRGWAPFGGVAEGPSPKQEHDQLKQQAAYLESALTNIQSRLQELESSASTP